MNLCLTSGSRFHRRVMLTSSLFDKFGRFNPYVLVSFWTPFFELPQDLLAVAGVFARKPPAATEHFPRRRRVYWRRDED